MPRIFISYRRSDTLKDAGRLYDRLIEIFGKKNVFQDIDTIPPGVDFRQVLYKAINQCEVVLVLIGQNWLKAEIDGKRRLDNPDDFVRIEVETALKRHEAKVIPVLIDNASMPLTIELPESLHDLTFRNAIKLRDTDFNYDFNRLIKHLNQTPSQSKFTVSLALIPLVVILVIAGIIGMLLLNRNNNSTGNSGTQTALAFVAQQPTLEDPTSTPSKSPSATPMATFTPTDTYTPTASYTATVTVSSTPTYTDTSIPTIISTSTSTATATYTPSIVEPSQTPTSSVQPLAGEKSYPCEGTIRLSDNPNQPLQIIYNIPSRLMIPVASVNPGTSVQVTDDRIVDGRQWYQITYDNQKLGWLWDTYLSLSISCP